jgi:hypothetical protein
MRLPVSIPRFFRSLLAVLGLPFWACRSGLAVFWGIAGF